MKELNDIMKTLEITQRQATQLNSQVGQLSHTDIGMNMYISRIKKLALQSLDLYNEMHRQISLLNNENRIYELRHKDKDNNNRRHK